MQTNNPYNRRANCPKCSKPQWSDDPTVGRFRCRNCGSMIPKTLHPLVGAVLSMNDNGQYVLAFPEFREECTYHSWDDLQEELSLLGENQKKIDEVVDNEKTYQGT